MFHPPASLNDNVQHFLTLSEAQKILADLNQILHKTAFNPKPSNPCFLLAVLFTFVCSGFFPFVITTGLENSTDQNRGLYIGGTIGALIFAIILSYTCFFCLTCHFRTSRRRQLTNYVAQVNSHGNGVKFSFGGGGTTPRGLTVGSEFGGTYENFYMAMWDPKGLMFKGYLHVFVDTDARQQWCSANGTYYVAPVPLGQAPVQVVAYQPPPGYALVPMAELQATPGGPSAPPSYDKAVG